MVLTMHVDVLALMLPVLSIAGMVEGRVLPHTRCGTCTGAWAENPETR